MVNFRLGQMRVGISIFFVAYFCFLFFLQDNTLLWSAMLAMAVHEIGHFVMMTLMGVPVQSFHLLMGRLVIVPVGMIPEMQREAPILLGGILFNFLAVILFFLFGCPVLARTNLYIGLYNLLPAGDLDGGALVKMFLSDKYYPKKAGKIHLVLSFGISFLLLIAGLFMILHTGSNLTLFSLGLYITIQNIGSLTRERKV